MTLVARDAPIIICYLWGLTHIFHIIFQSRLWLLYWHMKQCIGFWPDLQRVPVIGNSKLNCIKNSMILCWGCRGIRTNVDVQYSTLMYPTNPYSFCIFPTKSMKKSEGYNLIKNLWILSAMLLSIHPHWKRTWILIISFSLLFHHQYRNHYSICIQLWKSGRQNPCWKCLCITMGELGIWYSLWNQKLPYQGTIRTPQNPLIKIEQIEDLLCWVRSPAKKEAVKKELLIISEVEL